MEERLHPPSNDEWASIGWLVEVDIGNDEQPDLRSFAVAVPHAIDAETQVLRFPGLLESDKRVAKRLLSDEEIALMNLKTGAVRPRPL